MVKKTMRAAPPSRETETRDQIVPLGSLAYTRPSYLALSAWTEHVPFAFWLIEAIRPSIFVELGTHYGVSYFAFCQAMEKLDLGAQAFAVDLWTGDEHSGLYGPEVFQAVKAHNDRTYSHFSTLKKGTFDDALGYFLDGSVDLLHIDGLHTYDAVKHDFESWLPKMSPRGVIVFHDTNVRERDFGVFRLFAELKEAYPAFEFTHGHGLGVVGIGAEQAERMRRLFDADLRDREQRDLQTLFSGLGRGCLDGYKAQLNDRNLAEVRHQLAAELSRHQEAAKQAEQKAASLAADIQKRAAEAQAATTARGQMDAHVKQIETELARQQEAARQAEQKTGALAADLDKRTAEVQAATAAHNDADARAARLDELREQQDAALRVLEEEATNARRQLQESERQSFELRAELDRAREALQTTEKQRSDTDWRRGEIEAIAAERERHLLLLEEQMSILQQGATRAERELEGLRADYRAREEDIEAAARREAELHDKLAETQSALAQRQHETEQNAAELAGLRAEFARIGQALAERDKIVVGFKDHVSLLMADVKERHAAAAAAEERYARRLSEAAEEARTALEQAQASERAKHAEALRKEKSESEARLKQRFEEIATLSRLLKEAEVSAAALPAELKKVRDEAARDREAAQLSGGPRDLLGRQSWEAVPGFGTTAGLELGRAILKIIELPAIWNVLPARRRLKHQMDLLRRSGLFDAAWYLSEYRDVAEAGVDPIQHYIEYGAREGREPNGALASGRRAATAS